MKRLTYTICLLTALLFIALISCEKLEHENPFDPENPDYSGAPVFGDNPYPSNGATGVAAGITLTWSCTDPDSDPVNYNVHFGTTTSPPVVNSGLTVTAYNSGSLERLTTYYWKIVADDGKGNLTDGPVWSFTTIPETPAGEIQEFELGNSGVMITMVWIPSGTFMMGAQSNEDSAYADEYPRHQVNLSRGFWLGKYEVTQSQWEAVMGDWNFYSDGHPNQPAENIEWGDVQNDFSTELNSNETSEYWRLPTEAEWEYACRAGNDDSWFWWGNDYGSVGDYAWYSWNSASLKDVGGKIPNPWGLYDMHGNAWELCQDWYDEDYYDSTPATDPQGPISGQYSVQRGGASNAGPARCRSAFRRLRLRGDRGMFLGFRIAKSSPPVNLAPDTPSDPSPTDGAQDVSIDATLSWTGSDPNNDPISYDIYFGTSPNPPLVEGDIVTTIYDPGLLDLETTFYWKVIAKDDELLESSSEVWSFTTLSLGDPPNPPSNPNPADGANDVTTNTSLSWTCSDPDDDSLTYDIYLGTSTTPTLASSDLSTTTYDPESLNSDATYYWKIVASDNALNETVGDVWSFTTIREALPGEEQVFELGSTGEMITMVWIPSGSFMMGAQDDENDAQTSEYPRHQVTISEGFWMGRYEITQAQWEAIAGYENFNWPGNPELPAEEVSYNDIMNDFLPEIGNGWRLPTEAEWEYACRAGHDDSWFWWGSSYDNFGDYAWYDSNSSSQTHDVGGKTPNPWGLYDMHGNVWEWCLDWYDENYYDSSPTTDPQGAAGGTYRVLRGGSWYHVPEGCRSANRYYSAPDDRGSGIGFRVVRSSLSP
ncbi:MAG: SUMF1/EgtB/PvdO family nonheme iron enzyme [Candidatus Electryonea clarkiae]|nr:SUMF1/EgtB/PvdO family nonheme iron enzyme [Candidatus Electryonea clarkiae]MDP8289224.1 SUMF1/EgtB/PvdO family nonheme iron enzyme [Candidatus Electryonea clarkiae]